MSEPRSRIASVPMCDPTPDAGDVLMDEIAEGVFLEGDLLALFYFVIQVHPNLNEAAGDAHDVFELVPRNTFRSLALWPLGADRSLCSRQAGFRLLRLRSESSSRRSLSARPVPL